MAPNFSEEEIDDLIYFARVGEKDEFETLREELCKREGCSATELLESARDNESGNGVLHMSAANGHHGNSLLYSVAICLLPELDLISN